MRGANNLQRQLQVLAQRHGITLSQPSRVPKTTLATDDALILEGMASGDGIDCDRVKFLPYCYGSTLPTALPLLVEHAGQPIGTAAVSYDSVGGLWCRTSPLSGEARLFAAFSISVRDISYELHAVDRRDFHATVTSCSLSELSLTQWPHLNQARVLQRIRPNPQVEFYNQAQRCFEIIGLKLALLQRQMEASR